MIKEQEFEEWANSILKFGTDAEYGIAREAWSAATKKEREACAKTCEEFVSEVQNRFSNGAFDQAAEAIRMRSNA